MTRLEPAVRRYTLNKVGLALRATATTLSRLDSVSLAWAFRALAAVSPVVELRPALRELGALLGRDAGVTEVVRELLRATRHDVWEELVAGLLPPRETVPPPGPPAAAAHSPLLQLGFCAPLRALGPLRQALARLRHVHDMGGVCPLETDERSGRSVDQRDASGERALRALLDRPGIDGLVVDGRSSGTAQIVQYAAARGCPSLLLGPLAVPGEQLRSLARLLQYPRTPVLLLSPERCGPASSRFEQLSNAGLVGPVSVWRARIRIERLPDRPAAAPGAILAGAVLEQLLAAEGLLGPVADLHAFKSLRGPAQGAGLVTWRHARPSCYGSVEVIVGAGDVELQEQEIELTGTRGYLWFGCRRRDDGLDTRFKVYRRDTVVVEEQAGWSRAQVLAAILGRANSEMATPDRWRARTDALRQGIQWILRAGIVSDGAPGLVTESEP